MTSRDTKESIKGLSTINTTLDSYDKARKVLKERFRHGAAAMDELRGIKNVVGQIEFWVKFVSSLATLICFHLKISTH